MSKFQELSRRMIPAGPGQRPHPERPCVHVTICSCRWDLLLPFPCPTAISSRTPKRPSALSPLCFTPTLTPPSRGSSSVLRFQTPTTCPQRTSQYASILSSSPLPMGCQLSIGWSHLDVTPAAYTFKIWTIHKQNKNPEVFLYRKIPFPRS